MMDKEEFYHIVKHWIEHSEEHAEEFLNFAKKLDQLDFLSNESKGKAKSILEEAGKKLKEIADLLKNLELFEK